MTAFFIPVASVAALTGCLVGFAADIPPLFAAFLTIAASGTLILFRRRKALVLICVGIIAILIGILRVGAGDIFQESALVEDFPGVVSVQGTVVGDIEHRASYSRYAVAARKIDGIEVKRKESILVYEPYPSRCVTGEEVTFSASLIEPEDFLTDTGRVFPYRQYLRQFNIRAISFARAVSCTGSPNRTHVFAMLRQRLVSAMHRVLPAQEASLLGGLLLGLRGSLSKELLEAFQATGLIHIIVLSGYNVTLVAEASRRVFSRIWPKGSTAVALITVLSFVLLAGMQTAAVRAGIMAVIALVARSAHREYDGIRALLFVAMAMTLIDPSKALLNISFHLSFLATLGLLIFAPILERHLHRVPERLQVRSIVAATIATQCALLPYLAYAIGEISLVGVMANIAVLPIIPIAMAGGAITVTATLVLPIAGLIIMPIAYVPLHTITEVTAFFASVPHASVPLPAFPALWAAVATAAILAIGLILSRRYQTTSGVSFKK